VSLVAQLEEMALLALRRALHEHHLAGLHGVERASPDLARLLRVLGAEFAILADVQVVQRAGPMGGRNPQRGVVRQHELGGAVAHRRHGGSDLLRQIVVGVFDLVAEDRLGVFEVVRDRPGADV
jgi:hypothetical protein